MTSVGRIFFLIECFHSCGQHLCKFIGTTESVCIRKELNSQRIGLGHYHGRRFIVLGHQYGRRDVIWKHSIELFVCCMTHEEKLSIQCCDLVAAISAALSSHEKFVHCEFAYSVCQFLLYWMRIICCIYKDFVRQMKAFFTSLCHSCACEMSHGFDQYIQTYTHTYIHTDIHTYLHKYIHTYIHT